MGEPKPKNNLEKLLASKKASTGTGGGGLSNLQQLMSKGDSTHSTTTAVANGKTEGTHLLFHVKEQVTCNRREPKHILKCFDLKYHFCTHSSVSLAVDL